MAACDAGSAVPNPTTLLRPDPPTPEPVLCGGQEYPASDLSALADADLDGVRVCDGDCDDADPLRFPGAEESCDGVDADCDGVVEIDSDQDAALDCSDCAPDDPGVYPGAAEVPGNGVDDDCDTFIDLLFCNDPPLEPATTLSVSAITALFDEGEVVRPNDRSFAAVDGDGTSDIVLLAGRTLVQVIAGPGPELSVGASVQLLPASPSEGYQFSLVGAGLVPGNAASFVSVLGMLSDSHVPALHLSWLEGAEMHDVLLNPDLPDGSSLSETLLHLSFGARYGPGTPTSMLLWTGEGLWWIDVVAVGPQGATLDAEEIPIPDIGPLSQFVGGVHADCDVDADGLSDPIVLLGPPVYGVSPSHLLVYKSRDGGGPPDHWVFDQAICGGSWKDVSDRDWMMCPVGMAAHAGSGGQAVVVRGGPFCHEEVSVLDLGPRPKVVSTTPELRTTSPVISTQSFDPLAPEWALGECPGDARGFRCVVGDLNGDGVEDLAQNGGVAAIWDGARFQNPEVPVHEQWVGWWTISTDPPPVSMSLLCPVHGSPRNPAALWTHVSVSGASDDPGNFLTRLWPPEGGP